MSRVAMYSTSKLFGNRVTGGLKRFLELYYGLKNNGVDVELFCADSPEILKEKNISANTVINEKVSKNIFIPIALLVFLENYNGLKKLKENNYNKVLVFDVPTAISLCIVGVKNIQLFIRQDLIEYKNITASERIKNKMLVKIYLFFMKLSETICLIKADKILIQCKYDYGALIKRHGMIKHVIKRKSVIQINNVNPSWIVENSLKNELDNDIFKKNGKHRIGFIGDFGNARKGQRIFADAIKNLMDKGIDIEAILIGDGLQLPQYKDEFQDYPMIKFTGRLDNPIGIIKSCDIIVVPSFADSCPNTVMEALYNEIPVIGARSGGIPEILNNDDWLFEPDSASLQNKIELLLDDNKLDQLKGLQMQRKKELTFDWTKKIIDILEKN